MFSKHAHHFIINVIKIYLKQGTVYPFAQVVRMK